MIPTDVPIHRPSVGAMAVTTGSQMPPKISKPYLYRGTGEDQFPETQGWGGDPKQRPTKAELAERRRKKQVARQRRADRLRAKRERNRQRREREREEHLARMEAKRAAGWKPGDEGRVTLAKRRAERAAEREAARAARAAQAPRPAEGWKPTSGADIDDILSEIGG
jgi:hypothetical protein